MKARNPSLFEYNTKLLIIEKSKSLRRPATLDDVSDEELRTLKNRGFDWIWFMGVWQTGPLSEQIARNTSASVEHYRKILPDLILEEDVQASPFSIANYHVSQEYGGDGALDRLRSRMKASGLRLMLDFVPNHVGPDHRWVREQPQFLVQGTPEDLARAPQNYTRHAVGQQSLIFAYGRDPNFAGWPDTIQLNYTNPFLQEVMRQELLRIASQCDGLRCDMAMLLLPDVYERTWGVRPQEFWPGAIKRVRARYPEFTFMAEVYWDLEWTLQQQGFDYTYDKKLYDLLLGQRAQAVHEHLQASADYQRHSVRFLENHDEPRAATAFPWSVQKAAAVAAFVSPGMRFFYEGQSEGRRFQIPVQLARRPDESVNEEVRAFYERLLALLRLAVFRDGQSTVLNNLQAWEGNGTFTSFHCVLWQDASRNQTVLAAVNYADHQSQCYLKLDAAGLGEGDFHLEDQMSDAVYLRRGDDLRGRGLYLDLPAWGYHAFVINPVSAP